MTAYPMWSGIAIAIEVLVIYGFTCTAAGSGSPTADGANLLVDALTRARGSRR